MAEYSELLTKLMDDVVHRPSEIRASDVVDLSIEELAVYMKFLAKQKREIGTKFEKLVKRPPSEPIKEIVWTQSTWLEDSVTTISGFTVIGNSSLVDLGHGNMEFRGLGDSAYSGCVLDGDAHFTPGWWNCVGVIRAFTARGGNTIPGPLYRVASRNYLYIWKLGD